MNIIAKWQQQQKEDDLFLWSNLGNGDINKKRGVYHRIMGRKNYIEGLKKKRH